MTKIYPRCRDGSRAFISAEGMWVPCCQVSLIQDDYKKSILNANAFSIAHSSDLRFHESDLFHLWLDRIEEDFNAGLTACKYVCSKKIPHTSESSIQMKWMEEYTYITEESQIDDLIMNNNLNNE